MPDRLSTQRTPSEAPADLGARIRQARLARGMSLAELAGEELSPSFLSLVERNRRSPTVRSLGHIARRLGLPITHFLSEVAGGPADAALALDLAEANYLAGRPVESLRMLDGVSLPGGAKGNTARIQGLALLSLGQPETAVTVLEAGVRAVDEQSGNHQDARLTLALTQALIALQSFDEAELAGRRALQAAEETQDQPLTARVLLLMAEIENRRGNPVAGRRYLERAIGYAAAADLNSRGTCYLDLSAAHSAAGRGDVARGYAGQAVALLAAAEDTRAVALGLAEAAKQHMRSGDREAAQEALATARRYARSLDAPDLEAAVHGADALAEWAEGDRERAEASAGFALQHGGHDRVRIDALIVLGQAAEQRGRRQEADSLLGRALETARLARERDRIVEVADLYSRILEHRGDTASALRYARMAADPDSISG